VFADPTGGPDVVAVVPNAYPSPYGHGLGEIFFDGIRSLPEDLAEILDDPAK
jgi:hypothetical protein